MGTMIPIADAIRPATDRDQCGSVGEQHFRLAKVLEDVGTREEVYQSSTPDQLADCLAVLTVPAKHRELQQAVIDSLRGQKHRIPMTLGEYVAQSKHV